jgi:hypothetical protein
MERHSSTFHGEHWVYALAGAIIIFFGILLYVV